MSRLVLTVENQKLILNMPSASSIGEAAGRDLTLSFGRNSTTVTAGTFLRSAGNVSTSASAPVLPRNMTLVSASMGVAVAPGSAWSVDILVNGSTVTTLVGTSGVAEFSDDVISVDADDLDRIGCRVSAGAPTLSRPVVMTRWRLR